MPDYDLGTAQGKINVEYDGKGVRQAEKDFEGVDKSARKSSGGLHEAAGVAGIAGAGIAAGLGIAAKTAMDFEAQISAIGAVSGATQADLDMLSKKALQIGADTSFSATQAASAMEELAKAGISIPDIMNGAADATVALAAAGGVALPEAAELAADAMNAFQLKAQDMPHIADLIAGAANASSISVSDFGQSLKQVGAVAQLTRTSFDDTATAIALMGKMGIKGSDAGTSLKTMLMNLNPQTAKQRDLMKELGIVTEEGANRFFDATGKAKPLAQISQTLQDALKGQTQQQKLATLETIFGSDAIRAASVLAEGGAKSFNEVAAAMGKVSAEDVAAKRLDNTAGSLEQLKGSAETLAISLGMALLPVIRSIIDALTGLVNWFNGLSDTMKTQIVSAAGAIATLLGLVYVIYQIQKAAKAFMVVWRLLNLSFIASPIGMVILLIVALVAAFVILWNKSEAFRNFWKGLWAGIQAAAKAVADWWTGTIVPSLITAWNQLKGAIKAVGDWITGTLWPSLKTAFEQLKAVINFVIDNIVDAFQRWLAFVKGVFSAILAAVSLVIAGFLRWYNFMKNLFNTMVSTVRYSVNLIISILKTILRGLNIVLAYFSNFVSGSKDRLMSLVNWVRGLPGRIVSALGNIGRLLYNKGRDLVWGFIDGIRSMIGQAKNAASDLVGAVARFLPGSPAKEGPLSGRGYVLLRAKRFGDDWRQGILSKVAAARSAASELASSVSAAVPVDNRLAVANAVTNVGNATVTPVVSPAAATHTESRSLTIQNLNLRGVWDFTDRAAARRVVATIHEELDRYEKEHK